MKTRRWFLQMAVAGVATGRVLSRHGGQALPAGDVPLHELSIREAGALLRRREISAQELTRAILERISALNDRVGAFLSVFPEEALGAAARADEEMARGEDRGPLHGIPVGLKDNQYTRGLATTAASPVLAGFVPEKDSTVAARLRRGGAIIVGKTRLPEFSFGGHTPGTHNPWDLSRTAGGSSGGSGAALAARMVPGATGGDTSGSIRNPAATNGVVGMKATYGRVSLAGIIPISWSLDHAGPMTRTVWDNAAMLTVLAGHDPQDPRTVREPVPHFEEELEGDLRGLRVGIPQAGWLRGFHRDCVGAWRSALDWLEAQGVQVREVELPASTDLAGPAHRLIRIAEAASYHEQFLRASPERYGPSHVRRDVEAGSLLSAAQYLKAQKVRRLCRREWGRLFQQLDLFLTPAMPAPAGVEVEVRQNFRSLFNLLGFPALVIPAGFSTAPGGLPVGLQLAASPFQESLLYRVAYAYESDHPWYRRRPPL